MQLQADFSVIMFLPEAYAGKHCVAVVYRIMIALRDPSIYGVSFCYKDRQNITLSHNCRGLFADNAQMLSI